MTRRPHNPQAFTLLETILALALMLALVGSVLGFYRYAGRVRENLFEDVDVIAAERQVMERMTAELRSAMVYPFIQEGLRGDEQSMRFITAALPGPAAWAAPEGTDSPPPAEHDLRWVDYSLRIVEDEYGEPYVAGLQRDEQRILLAEDVEQEQQEPTAVVLSGRIRFLRLEYHDGGQWLPTWSRPELPRAVRITLGEAPLEEGFEPSEYG